MKTNNFLCGYCYDKGYFEWYDRDQDGVYVYRTPCIYCYPEKPQVDRLVDFDAHAHMQPESAFMESQPHPF